ncbi:hypothetical protein A6V39_04735 [Candidatus Mycoplasma haematobovis]|uniref:Uncharacterized protein n=1 Tax=Candidatus Mycoplasma haematobovis TaxID=432608 RepID=A0A1A9QBL4_9MOLU|nr:hypothetical protein [Candidatus Mycoplasma haematobovis]OAL09857.1 hypothetical protein A6V39_04735 [Candidatus Mycoplasma haematobovis]
MSTVNYKLLILGGISGIGAISGGVVALNRHLSNAKEEAWNTNTKKLEEKVVFVHGKVDASLNDLKDSIREIDVDLALELNRNNDGFKYFDKAKQALKNWCSDESKKSKEALSKEMYCV